jgi:hypothetical protein
MIARTLTRRLERLEEQKIPMGETHIINVVYINSDGTEAPGGYQVTLPPCGCARDRQNGGKYSNQWPRSRSR